MGDFAGGKVREVDGTDGVMHVYARTRELRFREESNTLREATRTDGTAREVWA